MKLRFLSAFACGVAVAVGAMSAFGRDLVWTGSDGELMSPFWRSGTQSGLTPADGDSLTISSAGKFTFNVSALSIAQLNVSATGVSITGTKALTMQNGGGVKVSGSLSLDLPLVLGTGSATSSIAFDVMSGATLDLTNTISGVGSPVFAQTGGTVNMRGNNTFTGALTISGGNFHAWSNGAFGSHAETAAEGTSFTSENGAVLYFHGVETTERFSLGWAKDTASVVLMAGTTNRFHGSVWTMKVGTAQQSHFEFRENSLTVFDGPNLNFVTGKSVLKAGAIVRCAPVNGTQFSENYMSGPASAEVWFDTKASTGGLGYRGFMGPPTYRLNCVDAVCRSDTASSRGVLYSGSNETLFDICGLSQRVATIRDNPNKVYPGAVITNSFPARGTLRLLQNFHRSDYPGDLKVTTWSGRIAGNMNVTLEGTNLLYLAGKSHIDGYLMLTNKANLVFNTGARWESDGVRVGGGSRLTLADGVLPTDCVIEIADEGAAKSCLVLGANVKCASARLNGVALVAGQTYGASQTGASVKDDEHFSGSGVLAVGNAPIPIAEATWTAAGSDDLVTTVENWDAGGELPDFSTGFFTPTFAAAGERALFPADARLRGLVFAPVADSPGFTVRPSLADATVALGLGGLTVHASTDGAARTNVLGVAVGLETDQAWSFEDAQTVVDFAGGLSGAGKVTKTGPGSARFAAAGGPTGAISWTGGSVWAVGEAFGETDAALTLRSEGASGTPLCTRMTVGGGTFARPVVLYSVASNPSWEQCFWQFAAGTTTRFDKLLSLASDEHLTLQPGATVVVAGGATSGNYARHIHLNDGATFIVTNRTTWIKNVTFAGRAGGAAEVHLCSVSNDLGPAVMSLTGPVALRCYVADALSRECRVDGGGNHQVPLSLSDGVGVTLADASHRPVFDLNGYSQHIGDLQSCDSKFGRIESLRAATLYVAQRRWSVTWSPIFTGKVGLCFDDPDSRASVTLTGANTTSGALETHGTIIRFSGDGSWAEASELILAGGRLIVDKASRVSPNANYRLSSGGVLELGRDVSLSCRSFQIADAKGGWISLPLGVYDASTLPQYLDGDGSIRVSGDGKGFKIIFRK